MIAAEYGGLSEQVLEFSREETEPRNFTNNNSNKGSDKKEINSKHKTTKDDDHNQNSSKAEKNLATFNARKSLSQQFRAFSMRARLVLGRSRLRLLGFFVFYLAFVISGAMVFRVLELPTERAARLRLYALQIEFLRDHPCVSEKDLFDLVQAVIRLHGMGVDATLIRNVSQYSKIDFPTKWKSNFTSTIEGSVGQEIRKIAEAELMKEELNNGNWNLDQAIFFASTIVTTVGYGKVSPYTNAGKIFCILFGSVGIPITLVFSSVLVSICMHPIRKSQERMVMRFCGSEEDSMSFLGPLDNQDKPQYHQQPRPNILELARDVQPCYSEQGLRKKSQMHAVHFDQISKGSSKAKIDLTSDRFSWNSYIKEGESCEVHSVLTIATIPSETLGSMEYLAKDEHKTLSIPPTRNIPCITSLNSTGMMDLAQPSNSYPEIPKAFDDRTLKKEASNISEIRKHNEPTSEFEGNSQSTYKNDKNNNRPVSRQTTAPTYNYYDINQSGACCYSEKRSCTGNSEKKSHSSLFKKIKRTTNQPCLGKKRRKERSGSIEFAHSGRSTVEFSERYQHSVGTATSLVNRAGPSCLALAHFLISRFGTALTKGVPVSELNMGKRTHRRFKIRLLHFLVQVTFIISIVIFLPAFTFQLTEKNWSYLDAIYFCVISVTTVGLGDLVPSGHMTNLGGPLDSKRYIRSIYTIFSAAYLLFGTTMVLLTLRSFDEILAVEMGDNQHTVNQLASRHTLGSLNSEVIYGSGPISIYNSRPKVTQSKHLDEVYQTRTVSYVDLRQPPPLADPV